MTERKYRTLFDLTGKTALVTGGAGYLGREFCKGLAECGARVAVVDIDGNAAAELAEDLRRSYAVGALGIAGDVADPDAVADMVNRVVEEFGEINILHNNAATKTRDLDAFFAPFEEFSLEAWREIMAVNIDGMFLVAQAVGKQMIAQGKGGSVIQTSSIYGLLGSDKRIYEGSSFGGRQINNPAVYSVSKAAVIGLSRWLATNWAEHNIRVNTLIPGGVQADHNEAFVERYSARVPLGRMAERQDIVGTVLYLASDASSYVTGQNFWVDGGLSAW